MPKLRISLRNRLALVFFGITCIAIAALYLYVGPGLQTRLIHDKLGELAGAAHRTSGPIARTVGSSEPASRVHQFVRTAGARSGDRVTLLSVSTAVAPGGPQLSLQADSSGTGSARLRLPAALRAASTGRTATATESTHEGTMAEAAIPVFFGGRVAGVIAYSAPVADILRNVSTVRHEILVAGGIALLLALVGGYLVARAISQRVKRLERAAKQIAAGDFEHPIRVDTTDELGQLALAFNEMQRQLAQLDSARKKFIATASHELRTPIFSLGGFVELLEDDTLDPETRRRFLDQVRDQTERLRKLSVDLLDLSKLEAGSLELREEQVDLGELTRAVSGEFEPTLVQHDSHLELRLPRRLDAICDPVRVAQIVRILIDNALTHTPPGTRITVTAGHEDGEVKLAVRDNGEGVDHQSMPRIFEPFYTADDAQGSGLGLAIASELAERMSGHLSVASEPGDTVFTLELPVGHEN
ncbi:MAG TPA: HAMP domain-containing sensor histidine kinase [Solirubrobacteraceae bacterium]|jgi:signal transduction histidine kinase